MNSIDLKNGETSKINYASLIHSRTFQKLLEIILKDKTTGQHIVWTTDIYQEFGILYKAENQISSIAVLNLLGNGLQPRVSKTLEQQQSRTKERAEVFTPSWIVNQMNNLCDEQWFGKKNVFNREKDRFWIPMEGKIRFEEEDGWKKYVDSRRLEITCGEAPYLVSRYDASTGEYLEIKKRIGILDRKIRVVNENVNDESEWIKWCIRAYQSTYGYEFQGDNLLFARINLLLTFDDYYEERWKKEPDINKIKIIADIITWNLWQMDGLKDCTPYGIPEEEFHQISFFDLLESKKNTNEPGLCVIKDWRACKSGKKIKYIDLKGVK